MKQEETSRGWGRCREPWLVHRGGDVSRGLSRDRGLMLMQKVGNMFIADAVNDGHGVRGEAEETTASEQSEEGGGRWMGSLQCAVWT